MVKGIISTIITAILTGLVGLCFEKRKEKHQEAKEKDKEKKEIFKMRPELKVIEYKDYSSRVGYGIKQKCDIELFVARIKEVNFDRGVTAVYHDEDFNQNEWCCFIYTLKNVGKTDISVLDTISNYKKDTCIFPCSIAAKCAAEGIINYSDCYDKKIRVDETVRLKLCYHKERIISSFTSSIMSFGLQDSNRHYWEQPFFSPYDKLYDSFEVESKDYFRNLRADEGAKLVQG